MSTFKPIAPIEPDAPFDEDSYDAMIGAMDDMLGDDGGTVIEEAFNINQPRFPKGHERAGQWRPKLVTGAGRVAPGHLERDLATLKDRIATEGPNPSQRALTGIGQDVEKVALRYSARKTYEKRIADIRIERIAVQDRQWAEWEKRFREMTPEQFQDADPSDMLSASDKRKLSNLANEEIRLRKQRDFADRDAMLGVLQKIRPMGGTLRQAKTSYAVDQASGIERKYIEAGGLYLGPHAQMPTLARKAMKSDLDESLKQVLKVVPKAWLDDTNGKGEVSWLFSLGRAYADTRSAPAGKPDEWKAARDEFANLGAQGYKFLGVSRKYDTFLMFRAPDTGDVIALRKDGEIIKGIGAFENTPLVLDAKGEMSLPEYAERPSTERLREFIEPMKNLPQPRIESGSGGAMGPNWDAYKEMRDAVAEREKQGWKFVGMRGKWATLRKGDEEVSLNWGGAPLTRQVGPPEKRDLPPLNPYGQIPLPPLPVRQDTLIKIDPREKATLLHELSHRLEVAYGEENRVGYNPIAMATHAFRDARTAGEGIQKLKDLYPNYAYEDHEMAKPDKFVDGYIGKLYAGQSTEVLTMGMEMLWFPKYGERDINKDPEMRQLILGLQAAL